MVAGVLDQDADAAGHGGMAGGVVVAGTAFLLFRQGAQPSVAFREHGRVGGVGGVGGRDDRGALFRHPGQFPGLQGVAGVLAGVAAGHKPVVGGGVLAVAALDEPAAADRHQPGVRVGDVALRLLARPVPAGSGLRLRFRDGWCLQVRQPGTCSGDKATLTAHEPPTSEPSIPVMTYTLP